MTRGQVKAVHHFFYHVRRLLTALLPVQSEIRVSKDHRLHPIRVLCACVFIRTFLQRRFLLELWSDSMFFRAFILVVTSVIKIWTCLVAWLLGWLVVILTRSHLTSLEQWVGFVQCVSFEYSSKLHEAIVDRSMVCFRRWRRQFHSPDESLIDTKKDKSDVYRSNKVSFVWKRK